MIALLLRALKDFFNPKILGYAILPILLAGALLGGFFYMIESYLVEFFAYLASFIPFVSKEWIASVSTAAVGIVVFYEFWLMSALILVGLVSDKVVDAINEKYYHLEKKGFGTTIGSIVSALKANAIYIFLLLIISPLLLIPGVNLLIHILLWMLMLKAPMYYDACAFYANKQEFKEISKENKKELRLITFFSALMLLIPFVGVFLYIYQLILYTHASLTQLKQKRLS